MATRRSDQSTAEAKTTSRETSIDEVTVSIGELAEQAGVSTRTIRYYEELGILPVPERTVGGTRRYPRKYILYVEGARTLKQLGFGLEEIAELGQFTLNGAAASERTQAILEKKLSELDRRVRVLNRLHDLVTGSIEPGHAPDSHVLTLLRWAGEESNGDRASAEFADPRMPAGGKSGVR